MLVVVVVAGEKEVPIESETKIKAKFIFCLLQ